MRLSNFHITEVGGYHLTECIGSGGMGDVYKAVQPALNRVAAVKVLHQKDLSDRFRNEAHIHASIQHPNIARLYDYVFAGETPCIIMEYVEGESLDNYLAKRKKLSNEETEKILLQIASALAYLHKKDILHRDIKPQNFKIQTDGTVKMLDFGIAKNKYSPKFTQQGFVVGTTQYMAPEQFQQQAEKKSDTWSLGVMTYELLTGFMPFEGDNPVLLRSKITKGIYTDPAILAPQIAERLLLITDRCLKISPANRISAMEIVNMLSKKKLSPVHKNPVKLPWLPSRSLFLYSMAAMALLLFFIFLMEMKPGIDPVIPDTGNGDEKKIMINASGIVNAELILNDNTRRPLPYAVKGKEGDKLEFIIHADGYKDKKVEMEITSRRSSYEFNLEKNNN